MGVLAESQRGVLLASAMTLVLAAACEVAVPHYSSRALNAAAFTKDKVVRVASCSPSSLPLTLSRRPFGLSSSIGQAGSKMISTVMLRGKLELRCHSGGLKCVTISFLSGLMSPLIGSLLFMSLVGLSVSIFLRISWALPFARIKLLVIAPSFGAEVCLRRWDDWWQ